MGEMSKLEFVVWGDLPESTKSIIRSAERIERAVTAICSVTGKDRDMVLGEIMQKSGSTCLTPSEAADAILAECSLG